MTYIHSSDFSFSSLFLHSLQLLLRDLGSLSRTPKFYQEVSSGSMEAFTSTNTGQAQPTAEKPPQLPYIEVDHRFSSMDCQDHTGISMLVPEAGSAGPPGHSSSAPKGISASPHSVSSGSTNTNHSTTQNNTNNITINTNHTNNTNNTTKPPASPNHYVASPPTSSNSLATASSESFSKNLYPSGMPPQYVNHSQSQRAALQAADSSGMFTGMVRTSPAGTPVAAMRRLGSASTASSPPLGHRGINTAKSVPGPGQGMMGMTGLYPSSALPRTNSTGSHLTQHQQLYAQQQQQQQQALLQQQQLQQHHALYGQQPTQRVNQPPSYRSGPPPPANLQGPGPGQGQGQVHFGGSGAGAVPTAYAQQRARYEAEQTWGGDRVDPAHVQGPAGQNRYAQPAPSQRQQLMHAQHQQQQLYRLQQHQQQHQQQQQQQALNQASLDDRSPSPHLYLSPDFLDISGERHSNALSSPSNSGYGDRPGGSTMHRSTNSAGSDLSGALAGLGVGAGSVDLSKPKSSLLGGNSELSGFDETVEMYEYRMQQQQHAQAQQLRGRTLGPSQGASQGQSSQGAQNNLSQSGLSRVGSALSYNTAAPMYSLYAADSMNFARSGSESLASNLTQDLMGSLSSSSSLLFTTSPHTPLSALGGANPANPVRASSLSNTNNNNNNSTNNANIDSVDTSGDFLQEHYNQFS